MLQLIVKKLLFKLRTRWLPLRDFPICPKKSNLAGYSEYFGDNDSISKLEIGKKYYPATMLSKEPSILLGGGGSGVVQHPQRDREVTHR